MADDKSFFSKVYEINKSVRELNADLQKISYWVYQWKMQFNPDPNKQTNEVIFSRKLSSSNLGIVLDWKLKFDAHVDQKIKKCNRLIGLIRRLSISLSQNALLTIYKYCHDLDYGDILYNKPGNENSQNKLENFQHRACLAITGAIQETSRAKIFDELGLH